jgi:hypothetical protein
MQLGKQGSVVNFQSVCLPMTASTLDQDRAALSQALQRGDAGRAAPILRRLLKQSPRDPALHHTAAELSWRQGNRTKALKHFSAALDHARAKPDAPQAAAIHASASQNIGHLLGSYAIDCQGLVSRTAFMDLLVNPAIDPQAVAGAAAPLWIKSQPWRAVFDQTPEAANQVVVIRQRQRGARTTVWPVPCSAGRC